MIDTINKIFRISCGAEFALKLIGRKNCACVSCACPSMGGSHALFWSSHPVLEFPPPFGDLQAAVIPFSERSVISCSSCGCINNRPLDGAIEESELYCREPCRNIKPLFHQNYLEQYVPGTFSPQTCCCLRSSRSKLPRRLGK